MVLNRPNMPGRSKTRGCKACRSVATPVVTNEHYVGHGTPTLQRAQRNRRGFFNSLEIGG